jgi:hypothetical protein
LSISFIGSEKTNAEIKSVEYTTEQALDIMMAKMNQIRKKYLHTLIRSILAALEDEKVRKRLRAPLLDWLDVLPIYGLNSSSYDINVIKKYHPQVFMGMYPNAKSFGFIQLKKN